MLKCAFVKNSSETNTFVKHLVHRLTSYFRYRLHVWLIRVYINFLLIGWTGHLTLTRHVNFHLIGCFFQIEVIYINYNLWPKEIWKSMGFLFWKRKHETIRQVKPTGWTYPGMSVFLYIFVVCKCRKFRLTICIKE